MNAVDLFAGPGGWDEGIRSLGIRPLGIEWDAAACAVTHRENTLRGDTIPARRARQTHCKRNHPLQPPHLRIASNGTRRCRTCETLTQRERRERRRAA